MTRNVTKFTKYTSIALILSGSFAAANCDGDGKTNLFGYERCSTDSKLFTLRGNVGTFTKAGFNSARIDTTNGIYPTESFTSVFGEINGIFDINAVMDSDYFSKFEIGIGGAAAGLAYDSTKNDASGGNLSAGNGSGLNNQYIGSWAGYLGTLDGAGYHTNRQVILHNAYLDLQGKYFNFKLGRYESDMSYFSGYTQGFNIDYHTSFGDTEARPDNEVKLWWFSSFGRAFAYSQWFLDYYAVKATDTNGDGTADISYGIHALGSDVVYGGIVENEDGYAMGDRLLVRPFLYFYPGLYEAPGVQAMYEYQFGNGLGFKVTAQGFALHVHKKYTGAKQRYDETVDEWSGNLNLIAQGFIYNYNVRAGYYENFGSGNSHFGTYGNPMGLDFWTAGVYDIGASISDVINRNARTGYISGGGHYDLKYGTLSWDILGRITRSPRSDEESIALQLSHAFKNGLALGLKLEWYRDTTKAGYNPGASFGSNTTLTKARTDDRSHAFFTIDYTF